MFDTLAFLDRLADHRTEQELDGIPEGLIDRAEVKRKHEALIRLSLKPKSAVMRLIDAQEQAKGYKGCGVEGCMCSQCMSFTGEQCGMATD